MEKKKKIFEPIRRGAPSLPFDFTEALKKIERKIIIIKNNKGEICDYRPYYEVDINEVIENMQKLIDEYEQKIIETTGIPKEIFNKED